jgi:GTP-binding protein
LFVVDVAGSEGRDPVEDLQNLRRELDLYDTRLSKRPWFIITNKMDLPEAKENLKAVRKKFPKIDVVPVSAVTGEGMEELKGELERMLGLTGE